MNIEAEYHDLRVYSQIWSQESSFDLAVNKYLLINKFHLNRQYYSLIFSKIPGIMEVSIILLLPLPLQNIWYSNFPSLSFSNVFNMQHYHETTAFHSCWFIKLFMCKSILTVCIFCHIKTRATTDTKDTFNSRICFHIMLCFTQESVKLTSIILFHQLEVQTH